MRIPEADSIHRDGEGMFVLTIRGKPVRLTAEDLLSFERTRARIVDQAEVLISRYDPEQWDWVVHDLLAKIRSQTP